MKVSVGSNNQIKVEAVREFFQEYGFDDLTVASFPTDSRVSDQPLTQDETTRGAINRAVGTWSPGDDYGIGIESGLMRTPYTSSGYINFTAVAIYDGDRLHVGHSTGFEIPRKMIPGIAAGDEVDKIVHDLGITDIPNVGKREGGFLGILTRGRISRKDYTKQALKMAYIPIENKELYS